MGTTPCFQQHGGVTHHVQLAFNDSGVRAWQYGWRHPGDCIDGHCFCIRVCCGAGVACGPEPSSLSELGAGQEKQGYAEICRGCSPHVFMSRPDAVSACLHERRLMRELPKA